jgi:hypothetical protein
VENFWGIRARATYSPAVMTGGLTMKVQIRIETEFGWGERRVHEISILERNLAQLARTCIFGRYEEQ